MKKIILFSTILIAILSSCNIKVSQDNKKIKGPNSIEYANGFSITKETNYKILTINNPWHINRIHSIYYLVKNDSIITPSDGKKVLIPISKVCTSSATQYEPHVLLKEINSIVGICSPKYLYNPVIKERFKKGLIANLGSDYNINLEVLIHCQPNFYFASSYSENDPNTKRLNNSGIPIMPINDWMEETPLGRAEWIKVYGALYDKSEISDSIFHSIKHEYINAQKQIDSIQVKPTIMSGSNYKGTWYMPGGKCYMATLFKDAGADYLYASDTTKGSLPLSFEKVLHDFADCDIWLNAPVDSYSALISMDERHTLFKPTKTRSIYGFYNRTDLNGANDFWESGVLHPDLILKDLIWALHPNLFSDYSPTYIIKLKE